MDVTAEVKKEQQPLPTPSTDKEEYANLCQFVNAISQPMAPRRTAKKIYKLIKKSSKEKHHLRQGVVEVQRAIRKGERGLCVLAGNVTPVDVSCHIPGVCEEKDIPYVYTPSKEHLGWAAGHRRPTIMVLIRPHESYQELLDECMEATKKLPWPGME